MIPAWVMTVLDRELPNLKGGERDRIAEALYEAAVSNPALQTAVIDAIKSGAKNVLRSHAIADGRGDLAGEIARNSSQNVLFALGEG